MGHDLRGRSFLKLLDYTPEEVHYLLDLSAELKLQVFPLEFIYM